MKNPQRYTLALPDISYGMDESDKGEYVLWRDYARLEADVRNCYTAIRVKDEEKAFLEAEVERLRKAGDALASDVGNSYESQLSCVQRWNAAKEGKQS